MIYSESILRIGSWQFGWTHDLVYDCGQPYLERWIIWCGITLRLHRFHKGDDDKAFHDHPWWFITFPLSSYMEHTPGQEPVVISSWRPHFRGASHRHIVTLLHPRPVWTLLLTGRKKSTWGFWEGEIFTPQHEWLALRAAASGQAHPSPQGEEAARLQR